MLLLLHSHDSDAAGVVLQMMQNRRHKKATILQHGQVPPIVCSEWMKVKLEFAEWQRQGSPV